MTRTTVSYLLSSAPGDNRMGSDGGSDAGIIDIAERRLPGTMGGWRCKRSSATTSGLTALASKDKR